MENELPKARRKSRGKLTAVLLIVILGLAGACGYFFLRYRQLASKADASSTQAQTMKLTSELGKTILLPNEQPDQATVLDHTKLGDPDLIREARNGDYLLVYHKSRRVVLYRPGEKKVVDMFHVETQQSVPAAATTPQATPTH